MGGMVLLLHQLPAGPGHFDWLLQRRGSGEAGLLSFRVADRIDAEPTPEFHAQRIPDHRALYLTYEGPIHAPAAEDAHHGRPPVSLPPALSPSGAMGERGRVARVASGTCCFIEESASHLVIDGRFDQHPPTRWRGDRLSPASPAAPSTTPELWVFRSEILKISLGD